MLDYLDSNILNNLTQGELTVLRYIDAHQTDIIHMSIHELAEKVFSSTATILRLCKKMNLHGYSELKFLLKNQPIISNSNIEAMEQTINELTLDIENTARFIDTKSMEQVIKLLLSEARIHLYSGGLTTMALEYMHRFFLSCGRLCHFYHTAPLAYRAAGKMDHNDVLIIASTSGATPSIIRTSQIAKNSGALLIAISNLDNNPLSQLADINFYTFVKNRDYYGTDIKSRTSIFFIVDMILDCYLHCLSKAN